MGLLDTFKKHREDQPEDGSNGQKIEKPAGSPKRGPLSDDERERVIKEAREELPHLDRKVEENVERLRDLSRSSS